MEMIVVPETKETDAKAISAIEKARAIVIITEEDFKAADSFCAGLKDLEKEITSTFKDAKEKAFSAHRAICAAEAKHLEPVQEARKLIKPKLFAWQQEEERKRAAEEKRRQDEAKKRAEDEALASAEQAEKDGDAEKAAEILSAPVHVAPIVVAKTAPKAQTQIRQIWTYRIVNEALIPRAYLIPDASKLGQQARATQDSIKVPGVEFFQKPV